jgi:membrane protease YdiL (CAAX protease family)
MELVDEWMSSNPWHPRMLPFLIYITFIPAVVYLQEWQPASYPVVYVVQCAVVGYLLWRYRRLLPELNVKFHWMSVPIGAIVCVAWIMIGWAMAGEFQARWDAMVAGEPLAGIEYSSVNETPRFATTEPPALQTLLKSSLAIGWTAMFLRLLGMSILVPLFEELFIRSLLLRGLSNMRRTWTGMLQILQDMPAIGDMLIHTKAGISASEQPPMFSKMFTDTRLGHISLWGFIASTFVFTIHHSVRDYPACFLCAALYCGLLWITNYRDRQLGIGPVVWAHGITNALLWVYTVYTGDWQFL